MVLSNTPEKVVGLRRRMSANGAVKNLNHCTRAVSPSPDKHTNGRDPQNGHHDANGVGDDAESFSDGISQASGISSSSSSSSTNETEDTETHHQHPLGRHAEDAGGSSETLRPKSPGAKASSTNNHRPARMRSRNSGDATTESHSWFSYDMSIIIALASPLGQWLTGGDHVKNLILILLLVFYLHQLIEVPWTLYRMSISPHAPSQVDSESDQERLDDAHAELRSLEIIYLTLTVLSPLIGAILLRSISTSLTGDEQTMSWFSTSLFVLATGLRPWRHLVERLRSRSAALKSLIHQASGGTHEPNGNAHAGDLEAEIEKVDEALIELREEIRELDEKLERVSRSGKDSARVAATRMQELVDSVEKVMRKQQKQTARAISAHDARLAALEAQLGNLRLVSEKTPDAYGQTGVHVVAQSMSAVQRWYCWLLRMPSVRIEQSAHNGDARRSSGIRSPVSQEKKLSTPALKHKNSSEALNTHRHAPLDPIPEEGAPVAQGTRTQTKERHHDQRSPPRSPPQLIRTHIVPSTPKANISPVQHLIVFLFSPVRFALQILWTTLMLPRHVLRLVSA
ncbi:hypothetical protein BD410DRAFT_470751 [Rickenella mellea]|uniref:Uncharacterized protein n=1 Tax=Rickenella mellea TaxID=50990 RepID=A0A4Y7QHI3_9AGAM|nr:hypothetical protein BD410DRAFT_470751 [Rickenella mellea]